MSSKSRTPQTSPTTLHVQRVVEQDNEASWLWLVERLNPLLELQIRYRLPGPLRQVYDPADVLNDVWLRVLPRLGDLRRRNGHLTPVLVRFLSSTLLNRINELLRAHVRRRIGPDNAGARSNALDTFADECWTSAAHRASRSEVRVAVENALSELDAQDREVLVLRVIEQVPNNEAAQSLGLRPGTLAMRLQRAKQRLRQRLPESWIEELFEE